MLCTGATGGLNLVHVQSKRGLVTFASRVSRICEKIVQQVIRLLIVTQEDEGSQEIGVGHKVGPFARSKPLILELPESM